MGKAENHIERYLKQIIEQAGGMCFKFTSATSGVPDRIIVIAGHTVFVEAKSATGELSALQEVIIARIRARGGDVRVISTREQADDLLIELTTSHD